MDEALAQAEKLMEAWERELRRELPDGTDIFDAHVHLGTDIDGFRGDYDELERVQRRFGISRAFVSCRGSSCSRGTSWASTSSSGRA